MKNIKLMLMIVIALLFTACTVTVPIPDGVLPPEINATTADGNVTAIKMPTKFRLTISKTENNNTNLPQPTKYCELNSDATLEALGVDDNNSAGLLLKLVKMGDIESTQKLLELINREEQKVAKKKVVINKPPKPTFTKEEYDKMSPKKQNEVLLEYLTKLLKFIKTE